MVDTRPRVHKLLLHKRIEIIKNINTQRSSKIAFQPVINAIR